MSHFVTTTTSKSAILLRENAILHREFATRACRSKRQRHSWLEERESSLLTTYWFESTNHRDNLSRPAWRHGRV